MMIKLNFFLGMALLYSATTAESLDQISNPVQTNQSIQSFSEPGDDQARSLDLIDQNPQNNSVEKTEIQNLILNDLNEPGWLMAQQCSKEIPNHFHFTYDLNPVNHQFHAALIDNNHNLIWNKDLVWKQESLRDSMHLMCEQIIQGINRQFSSLRSQILAIEGSGQDRKIILMDWDGQDQHILLRNVGRASSPSISPSGSDLYFSSMKAGYASIYHAHLPGKWMDQLYPGRQCFQPRQSPDGKILLFSEIKFDKTIIKTLDLNSGIEKVLDIHPSSQALANWSANGMNVYFSSDRVGASQIYRSLADGSEAQRITFLGKINLGAAPSPDGENLVFSRQEGTKSNLYMMNLKTHSEKLLTNQGNNESPTWSPDGKLIAFCSDRTGHPEIYLIRPDGKGLMQITHSSSTCYPTWIAHSPLTSEYK